MTTTDVVWQGAPQLEGLLRPLTDLTLLPDNPRRGNVKELVKSLRRFGQRKPIGVNEDGIIIAGNHTFQAAVELGWTHIAAVDQSDLAAAEQRAYALADNRHSDLATYDSHALAVSLEEAQHTDQGLLGIGYDDTDLIALQDNLANIRMPDVEPMVAPELDGLSLIAIYVKPEHFDEVWTVIEPLQDSDSVDSVNVTL